MGYTEHVPEGKDFFKHVKSGIVHWCKSGELVSNCKLTMGANFKCWHVRFISGTPNAFAVFQRTVEGSGVLNS